MLSKPVIPSLVTDYPLPYGYWMFFYHDLCKCHSIIPILPHINLDLKLSTMRISLIYWIPESYQRAIHRIVSSHSWSFLESRRATQYVRSMYFITLRAFKLSHEVTPGQILPDFTIHTSISWIAISFDWPNNYLI